MTISGDKAQEICFRGGNAYHYILLLWKFGCSVWAHAASHSVHEASIIQNEDIETEFDILKQLESGRGATL